MTQIPVLNGALPAHAPAQLLADMGPALIIRDLNGIAPMEAVLTAATMIQAAAADIPAILLVAMTMMSGI